MRRISLYIIHNLDVGRKLIYFPVAVTMVTTTTAIFANVSGYIGEKDLKFAIRGKVLVARPNYLNSC